MKKAVAAFFFLCVSMAANADIVGFAVAVLDSYNPRAGTYTNRLDALGMPDGAFDDTRGIYSMGEYGWINLVLSAPVTNIAGPDLAVWEESTYFDDPPNRMNAFPDESADIYLSMDAAHWVLVGKARKGVRGSLMVDIAGKGVDGAPYVRIVDVSGEAYPKHEGFDLDSVTVFGIVPPPPPVPSVPEPEQFLMLLGGGMFLIRRVRHSAARKTSC